MEKTEESTHTHTLKSTLTHALLLGFQMCICRSITTLHLWQALEEEGAKAGLLVDMVHRKINLQEDTQAWEHEKYSMRRLPAFTLSRLQVLDLSSYHMFFVLLA